MGKNLFNSNEKYLFDYSTRKMLDQLYFILTLSAIATVFCGYIFLYVLNLIFSLTR